MAQINNSSVTVATEYLTPTSPIERILIAHLNLHEVCYHGKSLGEDASLEEISEQILFYHRGNPFGTKAGEDEEWNFASTVSRGSCSEEAVSFLGLCKALYVLPLSLNTSGTNDNDIEIESSSNVDKGTEGEDDRTNSIYFGNSMLVFVPLESTLDVVAIVQVSRLYQNGTKSHTGSGNPLAISVSIERTHRLFCILHGGGILHRLDERRTSSKTANNAHRYPGMKQLFGLLKEIRETKDVLSRKGDSVASNHLNITEEIARRIAELEAKVKSCRENLPIRSLRGDLNLHYNEYLSYFLEVCIRNGGAGRCLVELMPVPIAQNSGNHIFEVPPSKMEDRHLEAFKKSILQILHSHYRGSPKENDLDSSLLGIAVFESSRLLHSFSNFEEVDLSNHTVSLLMAYMASYRTKMSYVAMSIDGKTPSSLREAQPGLLKRLLGPMVDKTPNQTSIPRKWKETEPPNILIHKSPEGRGRFLPSPPPFMLGASDRLHSLSYDSNKKDIWAPRVHLPNTLGTEWKIDDRLVAHMVLYEFREFSFLIFINLPSLENPGLSELPETTLLLMHLEEKLSETIIGAFQNESRATSNSISASEMSEPGQDILLVEQSKEEMILLLDPKLRSPRGGRKKKAVHNMKNKGQIRHFMGFGSRKEENISQSQSTSHRSTRIEWSALGLDCRHLFVSRLPLDICLAFDDMINEVRNAKHTRAPSLPEGDDKEEQFSSVMLELCTSLSYGWIYALATKQKEIYVFFDSSIYVTVADVQSAVQRIKERYFTTK